MNQSNPIVIYESAWRNSQLSIVAYTGRISLNGDTYVIVDMHGRDVFECSFIAQREGREKAIEPGAPCDLVMESFVPIYRKLGRENFLLFLRNHPEVRTAKDARKILKDEKEKSESDSAGKQEPGLFD